MNADPKDFRLLGKEHKFESHAGCTTPILADGRLYFRENNRLVSYDVTAR